MIVTSSFFLFIYFFQTFGQFLDYFAGGWMREIYRLFQWWHVLTCVEVVDCAWIPVPNSLKNKFKFQGKCFFIQNLICGLESCYSKIDSRMNAWDERSRSITIRYYAEKKHWWLPFFEVLSYFVGKAKKSLSIHTINSELLCSHKTWLQLAHWPYTYFKYLFRS